MISSTNSTRPLPQLDQALSQLLPDVAREDRVPQSIGAGKQASVFRIGRRDGGPLWEAESQLILKLYRQDEESGEAVRAEWEALVRMRETLCGRVMEGWQIATPQPIARCEQPPALLMTSVPGKPITTWLQRPPAEVGLAGLAEAIVAVLSDYWRRGGTPYGDLNFQNLLCDDSAKSLSLVDPGLPWSGFECTRAGRTFYPASHDLGYLLFEAAASVRAGLARPRLRRRQCDLAEQVLAVYLDRSVPPANRSAWLAEVKSVAEEHLSRFAIGPSARGLWRLVVRLAATRRVAEVVGRLRRQDAAALVAEPAFR
jgi:hypothetical protein